MDTQFKIKSEKIDPEYDKQEDLLHILPMPLIIPKIESTNDNNSYISPQTTGNIKIKLEPKDDESNLSTIHPAEPVEVPLPLPLISVKHEKEISKSTSALIDNLLDEFDDSLLNNLENIGNDSNNVILGGNERKIEDDRQSLNSNVKIKTEPIEKEIRKHRKENPDKHKSKRKADDSNTSKYIDVKKEKISEKKRRRKSSDDDNSRSGSPHRRSSKKNKRKDKRKSNSPSSHLFSEIALVRDYNHKSVPNQNELILPKPLIVKVEPSLLLPHPIHDMKTEERTTHPKDIKLEKQALSKPSHQPMHKVLKRCSNIINDLEAYEKTKYTNRILYTPISFIPSNNSSNMENRSPLLRLKNVQYKFSSSSKIAYKEFGIIAPPDNIGKLAQRIGFETAQLIDSKVNALNVKSETDVKASFLSNVNSFSSFYTNVSTQTDQLPCDQCIIRKLGKRHDISVQTATQSMNEIAVQTEEADELPILKEFHTLNINQQLALNDFYSTILNGPAATANDKLKLRDRLLNIFDMAYPEINASYIAPPPPVLPPISYNTPAMIQYPPSIPSASQQPMYGQYYQQQPPIVLNNYQQLPPPIPPQQMSARSNDPRRLSYDKYSRERRH